MKIFSLCDQEQPKCKSHTELLYFILPPFKPGPPKQTKTKNSALNFMFLAVCLSQKTKYWSIQYDSSLHNQLPT
jgi:hypothetical protein